MKKRILSIMLCLVMALGLVPVSISAGTAGSAHTAHCICGKSNCTDAKHGNSLEWTGISSLSSINKSGNYYLTQDVTISSGVFSLKKSVGPVNLCLNGKTITWTGTASSENKYAAIVLGDGASLTITDCHSDSDVGKIVRTKNDSGNLDYSLIYNGNGTLNLWNGCIGGNKAGTGVDNYGKNSIFNMYGGSIANNESDRNGNGGAVYNSGTFNFYGGSIKNNQATGGQNCSGAVLNRGTFSMTGGSIISNTAHNDLGGGVNNKGTFTMSGGSITDNVSDYYGGGVYNTGTFTMTGGSITGNHAFQVGGGVANNGMFTMTGGSITQNLSNDSGGGVFNYHDRTFTMTGGSITQNNTRVLGGGVDNRGTFNLSGAPIINNNKKGGKFATDGTLTGGTDNNVYIFEDGCAIITEGLSLGASIGLNSEGTSVVPETTVVTGTKSATGFFSDNTGYDLIYNRSNGFILSLHVDHNDSHCVCGQSDCTDAAHGGALTWTAWNGTSDIAYDTATKTAYVYLTKSVKISEPLCVESGYTLYLCLNGNDITYNAAGGISTVKIQNDANLIITDCRTIDGRITHDYNTSEKTGTAGSGIHNWGTLTLWNGCITKNGGYSGVYIDKGGAFTMNGGEITDNTWSYSDNGGGAGVYNDRGTFTMNGGTISGNITVKGSGGGVWNYGTFAMTGGTISGNTADSGRGGGVYNAGTFDMSGTAIVSNNTARQGGGVHNNKTFNMSGTAVITDNTATITDSSGYGGGGVCNSEGTFTMNGGEIKNNKADGGYGGGVCNRNKSSIFTMTGGSITGNSTGSITAGGGVYNYYGTFTMSGTAAVNNNTACAGGGVENTQGTFNMNGGEIKNNIATGGNGGGVYNTRSFSSTDAVFNMSGGTISGNSAKYSGGGVYSSYSGGSNIAATFNMSGGEIINNTCGDGYNGGGVWNGESIFTVSGNAKICGNVSGETKNNVYLYRSQYPIKVESGKPMSADANIGITCVLNRTAVSGTTDPTGFFSDNDSYSLVSNSDDSGLKLSREAVISGKLLVSDGGEEMTDGKKTYDAKAVVFADATLKFGSNPVDGATYTYTWQKKGEDGTYADLADLTGSTGPVDAGDYKLNVTATKDGEELASISRSFTIEKAKLTVTLDVKDKVYDGKTEVLKYKSNVSGIVEDGNYKFLFRTWDVCFEDANVGEDKTVTARFGAEGQTIKNYIVPDTLEGKASITPRPLTVNVTAQDKEYDGTTAADIKAEFDAGGVIDGDDVTLVDDGVTAEFDTKDFGKGKPVTLNGSYKLSGASAGNYTLAMSADITASIDKKELTIENLTVANKTYDGTDTAYIDSTPTLRGVVDGDDVTLTNGTPSFTAARPGDNIAVSFTEFTLDGADSGNYTLVQPTGITANIVPYIADKSEYSVNSNDWLNNGDDDFTVTAHDDWQLSYTDTPDGEWVDKLTVSQDTKDGTLRFYVRNKASGIISEVIEESYNIDRTAPTGEIRIDNRTFWEEFLHTITFGLFYKDPQTVTVSANDSTSGIKSIEYFMSSDDYGIDQLADKSFTEYEKPFGINPDAEFIVYAKITDNAGNVTYLRTDRIVLDASAPVISGADNNKTYCGAVTLTVKDDNLYNVTVNGNDVSLTDGKLTLDPAEGEQIVVATDNAGNTTTLTVTVNDGHTWGDWASNGDGTHKRTCRFDSTHTDTADCHGGTATCQEKAICVDCSEPYGDYGEHDWDMISWGYTGPDGHAHTCKTEGCTDKTDFAQHTPGAEATETTDQICTECGYVVTSKLGHLCERHLTLVEEKAPTCTEDGNLAYYKCECGKLYKDATASIETTEEQVTVTALGHDWTPATCTEPKTCKRDGCGATEGNALGHNYSADWSYDVTNHWHDCQNAGCTDKADFAQHTPGAEATETTDQICTECGYVIAPKLGHLCERHLTLVKDKAPTCTENGNIAYYKCECGKLYKDATASVEITEDQTVIAALGHDYEWKTEKEATATENGSKYEECRICHDRKAAIEIPASGKADTKTDTKTNPKTGDNSMTGLWIALLSVSAVGAAVTTVYTKKRKRSSK